MIPEVFRDLLHSGMYTTRVNFISMILLKDIIYNVIRRENPCIQKEIFCDYSKEIKILVYQYFDIPDAKIRRQLLYRILNIFEGEKQYLIYFDQTASYRALLKSIRDGSKLERMFDEYVNQCDKNEIYLSEEDKFRIKNEIKEYKKNVPKL